MAEPMATSSARDERDAAVAVAPQSTPSEAKADPCAAEPGDAPGPKHIAIIMDGNGRWAKARRLPRAFGHNAGVEALRGVVEAAADIGLTHLTVFGFSTENWTRPRDEVDTLFDLLRLYIRRDLDRLRREGVKVRIVGEREGLPADVVALIDEAERLTAGNSKLNLIIAFNYGGKADLVQAVQGLAADIAAGRRSAGSIDESAIAERLWTTGIPDPDLVIRTSGEFRISNFLLWQCAYSEFVFSDVMWPDFSRADLIAAVEIYRRRERRYGGVGSNVVEA